MYTNLQCKILRTLYKTILKVIFIHNVSVYRVKRVCI